MTRKNKKTINYYGTEDNYIHLKFGDCIKCYNFTEEFKAQYPEFAEAYADYWDGQRGKFRNAWQVVSYAYNNQIPVHFYYNFTDIPAKSKAEIIDYLVRENDIKRIF